MCALGEGGTLAGEGIVDREVGERDAVRVARDHERYGGRQLGACPFARDVDADRDPPEGSLVHASSVGGAPKVTLAPCSATRSTNAQVGASASMRYPTPGSETIRAAACPLGSAVNSFRRSLLTYTCR